MALHLIYTPAGWQACAQVRKSTDPAILMGDAVYAWNGTTDDQVSALQEDTAIRGVNIPAATQITYSQMVKLCETNTPIVSWND